MRRMQAGLTAAICCLFGAFLGNLGYSIWHYHAYPEVYLAQSAPWYTGLLFYGSIMLFLIILCVLAKLLLKRK